MTIPPFASGDLRKAKLDKSLLSKADWVEIGAIGRT
jgi:hypothetical protein